MKTFPKTLTIGTCEDVIKNLNEMDDVDNLLLPVDTAKYAFAGLASAIQAVITWGRKSNSRGLRLRKSRKSVEEQIEDIINRPYKLTAAMFAKSILTDDTVHTDLRAQVNLAAKTAIEKQENSRYGKQYGQLCWFAFVDHSSKGFDRNFYIHGPETKPEPRHPAQIQAVIDAMVKKSLQVTGRGKLPGGEYLDHLGRIIYELFLNTHEHGSRGHSRSEWLRPGVRLIYTYAINLTKKGVADTLRWEPVLSDYLGAQDNNKNHFIEISIIDSGLGYCDRWLIDNNQNDKIDKISIEEEYDIFKKCFTFRQTSTSRDNKGHGLPIVMDRLTRLKGFVRIRSGRLALYRDFIANRYESYQDPCEFSDWKTRKEANQGLIEMPKAVGVAITFLIPLEAKE
jgi:hypothetical protein